jgi:hypothetical protein
VDSDDIVLRVVSAAERFNAEKVSFSRSSVSGVTMWLEVQAPPLVQKKGRRIFTKGYLSPMADSIRLHLAALCAVNGGERGCTTAFKGAAILNTDNIQLLAECFLIPADELFVPITDFTRDLDEFLLVPGVPNRVIFKGSEDPFIEWIVKYSKVSSE